MNNITDIIYWLHSVMVFLNCAADNVVNAINFICSIVVWSENNFINFCPNAISVPKRGHVQLRPRPVPATSSSGQVWDSGICYNAINTVHIVAAAEFCLDETIGLLMQLIM